jgi:hypothetical protein
LVGRRKFVNRVLRDQRVFFISHRPEAVQSVNIGVPMVLGASGGRLRKEFAALAGFCADLKSARLVSA